MPDRPIVCPACRTPLARHCDAAGCSWASCRNTACVWTTYSLRRRVRMHRTGIVQPYEVTG